MNKQLKLSAKHTHAEIDYPPGVSLDLEQIGMSKEDAQRLVDQRLASWVKAEPETAEEKPGKLKKPTAEVAGQNLSEESK